MNIYIKNGRVILKERIFSGASIAISGSKIVSVDKDKQLKKRLLRPCRFASQNEAAGARNDDIMIIDAKGRFVSPGFIDCHIHGEPEKIFLNEARHGTTAFMIAESCAPLNYIYERAEGIKRFIETHPFGPNVLGMRLEGPYISKVRAGAQNTAYIRKPDVKELSEILKKISILKMMTIAPELKGAMPLIRLLRKNKIIASIGHSDATYESAIEGIDAGITHSTHTFNAMSGVDRREPGVVGAALMDDSVTAEIILDFIHVHKELFRLLVKSKKADKVIVVTDSLMALDCFAPAVLLRKTKQRGLAMTKGRSIQAKGGAYRFEDGRLAGSSLTMIEALKNAVRGCGLPLLDALRLITLNPAKLLGIEDEKGSIAAGKDADIVIFDKEFDVKMTMIRGKIAFKANTVIARQ